LFLWCSFSRSTTPPRAGCDEGGAQSPLDREGAE
jgi:hypothetical protein